MSATGYPENFPSLQWLTPPALFLPALLWSWNGAMTRERITTTLEGFAVRHIGGVYIHPRPGLITEYLSEEWFALWQFALEECQRLGLGCHIYDENSFPSGFAGGHVASTSPESANTRLAARLLDPIDKSPLPAGTRLAYLEHNPENATFLQSNQPPEKPAGPILSLELESFPPCLWHAGFPMVDVCRQEVTNKFLAATHDRYAKHFSRHMGKAIRHVFTDEPETGTSARGFHLSRAFLTAFHEEHGYQLEAQLAALCGETSDSPSVRHDYQRTLSRLFTENFARVNHDWCEQHGLSFTGHFNEHTWPAPTGSPSTMAAQRWMHAPGLDLLGFQFPQGSLREAGLWLFGAKEATSIASQCGRSEILCESAGGGGYGFGPSEMKPLEDFLLALGINRLVPHLSHESLAGARKYDWPQTLSEHSPWWDAYASQALHIGRVNTLLSAGTAPAPILVLNPTTTGWMRYRPDAYRFAGESGDNGISALQETYTLFLADLYAAQLDFDLGDECVMADLGEIRSGKIAVGKACYNTVVIPPGMENMLSSTADLLIAFLEAGGAVICASDAPLSINGRQSTPLAPSHPGWVVAGNTLIPLLRKRHPPRLSAPDGSALPADLLWQVRHLDSGDAVVFLANPTRQEISARVAISGGSLHTCDTFSGAVCPLANQTVIDGRVCADIALSPGGHSLWWVSQQACPPVFAQRPGSLIAPRFEGCDPLEPNLLTLDYCDYEGPGAVSLIGAPTLVADLANWHAQGFEQNLWQVSIQFRRSFLEAPIAENSGFTVRYHFHIAQDALEHANLHAGIERPWLYEISCNGIQIPQATAEQWFDEDMRLLPLGNSLRPGHNILQLRANQFHVLAEIMPVIIRGRFHASPTQSGFLLESMRPWENGDDWLREGAMFYCGRVRYRFTFESPAAHSLRVTLPLHQGATAGISLNGQAIRWLPANESGLEIARSLAVGTHRLDVILCGHLKNLLGPHFSNGLPGAWSWMEAPPAQPTGSLYRFIKTGLPGAPTIEAFIE